MPVDRFEVDPHLLRSGGDSSRFAGDAARKAAARLAEAAGADGLFGDFEAAHAFHRVLAAGREQHLERIDMHHRGLTDIGGKAHIGAEAVTAADETAADGINVAGRAIDSRDA